MLFVYLFSYFPDYYLIKLRLLTLDGVNITNEWRHDDVFLEDFGFYLSINNQFIIRIDFYERNKHNWFAIFKPISTVSIILSDQPDDVTDQSRVIKIRIYDVYGEAHIPMNQLVENFDKLHAAICTAAPNKKTAQNTNENTLVIYYKIKKLPCNK